MAVLIDLFSVFYGMFHVEHSCGNGFVTIDVSRETFLFELIKWVCLAIMLEK